VQELVQEHGLPAAAVPVAVTYMCILEDCEQDPDVSPQFRQYSRSLLRGSVGAAKAGGFLQLVLAEVAYCCSSSKGSGERLCT
jgi:hypothetical protein